MLITSKEFELQVRFNAQIEDNSKTLPNLMSFLKFYFPQSRDNLQRKEKATSTDGLKNDSQVWRGITQEYLENLYQSMPRRMQAVIAAQGGHTKY